MFPEIKLGTFSIPAFSLCAIAGVTAMVLILLFRLRRCENPAAEAYYIFPKLFIAFGIGFAGAVFFDSLFKIPQNGGFKLAGITFYGGAVTGIAALSVMLAAMRKNTRLSVSEWLDFMTLPFVVFHCLGRIGCFMGGCCYGIQTDSIFGMVFPDNAQAGIFHGGRAVYPTQLFEAVMLGLLSLVLLLAKKHNFAVYVFSYPVMRFCIEFLRGDDRGSYVGPFSPAQLFSLVIIFFAVAVTVFRLCKKRKLSS